jgi:hypothetical protein
MSHANVARTQPGAARITQYVHSVYLKDRRRWVYVSQYEIELNNL